MRIRFNFSIELIYVALRDVESSHLDFPDPGKRGAEAGPCSRIARRIAGC